MFRFRPGFVALALMAMLIPTTSCQSLRGDSNPESYEENPVVARIGDDEIVLRSLDDYLKGDWFAEQSADPASLYQVRRDGLDAMIDRRILEAAATRADMRVDEFIQAQIDALPPVSDEEIDSFYQENQSRISGSDDMGEIREAIREFLEEERPEAIIENLRAASDAQILLEPPRWKIAASGASRGPQDAQITIIEFSDYQCPFCRRAEATLVKLEALYPNQLRIVYRHFPLSGHADARPAAEAAVCAEAQGKFWEFHEVIFANQRELSTEKLRAYAEQVELDLATFDTCIEDEATKHRVETDIAAARGAGATATPTFFINGRLVRGAKPVSAFQKVIDEELARLPN